MLQNCAKFLLSEFSGKTLRLPSSSLLPLASFHTSNLVESRIKFRRTHKPFWHIKKTNKQPDTPITKDNRDFIEFIKNTSYMNSKLSAVGNSYLNKSPLKSELAPWPKHEWEGVESTRCGLIGRKIGVIPMWLKKGKRVLVTLIHIEDNHVIKYIPPEDFANTVMGEKRMRPSVLLKNKSIKRGCLVIGALSGDPAKFTKDYCGLFTETGLVPKKKLSRMPVSKDAIIQPGTPLFAGHFEAGKYVDIIGTSSRRGFQGVMKRWGFAGGNSDKRGTTKSHRRPGCIGAGQKMARVWPGKKLPGHMGGNKVKLRGMKILRINHEHNVIYLLGHSVPGEPGEIVQIFDTKLSHKKYRESPKFFPTLYQEDYEKLPEEEYADDVHRFEDPSFVVKKTQK